MTPTEPSSGKAANVPTHYETLRGLQKKLAGLKAEAKFYGSPFPDSKRQVAEDVYASYEALTALLQQHAALLADYEAVTAENRRLSASNERMREGLDNAIQQLSELAQPLTPALNGSYAKGEQVGYENAVRIISALRATLKGEKHD